MGLIIASYNHITPADVEVVFQVQHHALQCIRLVDLLATGLNGLDSALQPGWQHCYGITPAVNAAHDLSGIATVIVMHGCLGPDHVLNGKACILEIDVILN